MRRRTASSIIIPGGSATSSCGTSARRCTAAPATTTPPSAASCCAPSSIRIRIRHSFVIPAKAGIHLGSGSRPSPGRDGLESEGHMNVDKAINIEDLHRLAKRKLPKIIFDFIEGGLEDERGL